jgi:hypothetical protein
MIAMEGGDEVHKIATIRGMPFCTSGNSAALAEGLPKQEKLK